MLRLDIVRCRSHNLKLFKMKGTEKEEGGITSISQAPIKCCFKISTTQEEFQM